VSLTTTTLSSAVAVTDNSIVVGSATGFSANNYILVDQEVMRVVQTYVSGTTIGVLRGQNGSATAAHVSSANVVTFLGSDETVADCRSRANGHQLQRLRGDYLAGAGQ
jgi:hypothetical protein